MINRRVRSSVVKSLGNRPSPRAWAAASVAVAGVAAVVWQQRETEGAEAVPDAA
jgi:drug/metabolite transporter (DMT)-like permease